MLADPIWFGETVLGTPLWEKEKEIMLAVRDHEEIYIRSCHASGKTFTAARVAHWWLLSHEEAVVITTAPTFRQVKEILWREIRSSIGGKPLYPPDTVLDTQINLSDKWFALGLSSDKPDQFQGFHSPHLLVIGDEAPGIPEDIFQAVDGLAPEKILLLGNPTTNQGRFAAGFRSERVKKIHISAFDTPNIKAGAVVIPGLITERDIARIRDHYGEESDVYRVRILGEFPKQDADTLIGVDEVALAVAREVKPLSQWQKKIGVDVARFGNDRTVILVRQQEKVIRKELIQHKDLMVTCGEVMRIMKEEQVLSHNIFIDSIGIGAGVVDRLREQGLRVTAVNVGEKAQDDEHYFNQRTELYARVKDWLKTGSLPDDSFYELANIKYKFTSKGQLQLESKEDMKKRGLSSPDVADALALTFVNPAMMIVGGASPLPEFVYPEIRL